MPREIHLLGCKHPGLTEAGCDEAGRGCLAGAVFAAAVIFYFFNLILVIISKVLLLLLI